MEHHVEIPVPCRAGRASGLQGFLPGQSSTALLSSQKRISEQFVEQIEAFKIFAQDKVHPLLRTFQLVFLKLRMSLVKGFFAVSPKQKKCDTTSALEVGTASALEPMDAGAL